MDEATAGANTSPERPRRPGVVMDPATTFRRLVPVSRLQPWLTPVEDVYVVAHMGIARVDVSRWRLTVDGLVDRPLVFDYAAVTRLPAREVTAVLECFGNPVEPDVPTRRVGNVVWRGVALADLLAMAGVRPGAEVVWLEGLDWGTFANVDCDRYVKDVPLGRALQPDVLLAWAMNGQPLTAEHGFPLRAFIPGYFGTNAVKWLSRVHVARTRPDSLYTTRLYNRRAVVDGREVLEPVRELDVHAVIVRPTEGATVPCQRQVVAGWAWGAWPVVSVEISADGGRTWNAARLAAPAPEHAWRGFAFEWTPEQPGPCELRCRATDARGRTQPATGRNRIHVVTVTVR